MQDDYIKLCKQRSCMAMQSKAWMISFMFKEFLSFFKKSILGGIPLINRHLFILNRHGSQVTLEAIEQAQTFELNMITLLSHTNHALQLLDVACFKVFKITFRKEGDVTMVNNNYIELDKINLASRVEKVLDQSFTTKNILSRCRVAGIHARDKWRFYIQ